MTIGDDALRFMKNKLDGFDYIYDLAQLWYEWKQLPFVFAVWAVKKDLSEQKIKALDELLNDALNKFFSQNSQIEQFYNVKIGFNNEEIMDYLNNIVYRLGEKELEAIKVFREYYRKLTEKEKAEEKTINIS